MRTTALIALTVLAATTAVVAAIDTEYVPLDKIEGGHWTFKFDARVPRRIVVPDAQGTPRAYWYVLYTVTNTDSVAHDFMPQALMFTDSGQVAHDGLHPKVVEAVKAEYRLAQCANSVAMMGELKAGADEARDGIFVFPEVDPAMDSFKVFVTGLSGQYTVKTIPPVEEGGEARDVVLRKTLQMTFAFPGDKIDMQLDKVYMKSQKWIWR